MYKHPFEALIFENTKFLVLGSFPSLASVDEGFYYGHKRNQFWSLLNELFNEKAQSIEEKRLLCEKYHIGLFDVASQIIRDQNNSSDTNLSILHVHDFKALLKHYPSIETLLFTGKKAQTLFNKHFKDLLIEQILLPSPSPAYAAMPYDTKLSYYKKAFNR